MQLIVAVDNFWGIGKNNDLLFHMPEDLEYFKSKTLNKVIVMGGNTLLSFPKSKPLPKRTNIVLTDVFKRDDCTVCETIEELKVELKKYNSEDVFIVGGAMFYKTMEAYCDKAYITKVDANGEATHFFPNLDQKSNWEIVNSVDGKSGDYNLKFTTYINKAPKKFE